MTGLMGLFCAPSPASSRGGVAYDRAESEQEWRPAARSNHTDGYSRESYGSECYSNHSSDNVMEIKLKSKEWQRQLASEIRNLDKEIRRIQTEEERTKKEMRIHAQKDNVKNVQLLARQIVQSRKAVVRIEKAKANMTALKLQLSSASATASLSAALKNSSAMLREFNKFGQAEGMSTTMVEMQRELAKSAQADEMMQECFSDDEEMNVETEVEVQKVLEEAELDKIARLQVPMPSLPALPNPVAVPRSAAPVAPVATTAAGPLATPARTPPELQSLAASSTASSSSAAGQPEFIAPAPVATARGTFDFNPPPTHSSREAHAPATLLEMFPEPSAPPMPRGNEQALGLSNARPPAVGSIAGSGTTALLPAPSPPLRSATNKMPETPTHSAPSPPLRSATNSFLTPESHAQASQYSGNTITREMPRSGLGKASAKIEQQLQIIDAKIQECNNEARALAGWVSGNQLDASTANATKQKAKHCLMRKKMLEQQREQLLGTQFQVEGLAFVQEQADVTMTVSDAMKASQRAMQTKMLSIDQIERLQDDMADLQEEFRVIGEGLANPMPNGEGVDEASLEEEFARMQNEAIGMGPATTVVRPAAALPAAPVVDALVAAPQAPAAKAPARSRWDNLFSI